LADLRSVLNRIVEIKESQNLSLEDAKQKYIKNLESKEKLLTFQKKLLEIAKEIDTTKIDIQKGQLLKVDIPENDVLLDEDELLGNMKLQKGLVDKLLKWADENDLYYGITTNSTGEEIYDKISEKLGSDKRASELLNELGFKGITYNGKQDGRCYVVFD
jgi:hypothetical protein